MFNQTVTESLDDCLSALYSRLQPHDSLSVGRSSTVKMGSCKLATEFITSTLHMELLTPKAGNAQIPFVSGILQWKNTAYLKCLQSTVQSDAAVQSCPSGAACFRLEVSRWGRNMEGCDISCMHMGTPHPFLHQSLLSHLSLQGPV